MGIRRVFKIIRDYFNAFHVFTKCVDIVQTFELTNFKVWTVLSTEENVLLRLLPLPLPEMFSFVPSAIIQPFFELQTPDFEWKFVWIVQINYKSTKSTKKYISTKVLITQSFLELQTPDFAWKFICTVQPNEKVQKYKSTEVQKYKSTKVQKK